MPPIYQLRIMAPDQVVYEGDVTALVASGVEGRFGVLAHHAPMVVELAIGDLVVDDAGGARRRFAVAGGFLSVAPSEVTVLADAAEPADGIDVARARAARERAEERLRRRADELDVARAQAALQRALNRLHVAAGRTGAG